MNAGSVLRAARVGLHVLHGAAVSGVLLRHWPPARRQRERQRWSRRLLHILGVELRDGTTRPEGGTLVVANHISWLDVFALLAAFDARFVCKAEVRRWPVIGFLVARNEALFVERESRTAIAKANREIVAALRAGEVVVVFPEGTSSDGSRVLPFHAATFQSAIDAGTPVAPIAVRHVDASGGRSTAAAYCNDIGFVESMFAILGSRGLAVELAALPRLDSCGSGRRELASGARALITRHLAPGPADISTGRPACLRAALPSGSRPRDNPSPAPAAFLRA